MVAARHIQTHEKVHEFPHQRLSASALLPSAGCDFCRRPRLLMELHTSAAATHTSGLVHGIHFYSTRENFSILQSCTQSCSKKQFTWRIYPIVCKKIRRLSISIMSCLPFEISRSEINTAQFRSNACIQLLGQLNPVFSNWHGNFSLSIDSNARSTPHYAT